MPVIKLTTNASCDDLDKKLTFTKSIVTGVAEVLKIPKEHVHVHILDGQFYAHGGDNKTPGAYFEVQASSNQIGEESRKAIIDKLVPLVQEAYGCEPLRSTTYFVELPVENIAVGSNVMRFSSPRSGVSSPKFQ